MVAASVLTNYSFHKLPTAIPESDAIYSKEFKNVLRSVLSECSKSRFCLSCFISSIRVSFENFEIVEDFQQKTNIFDLWSSCLLVQKSGIVAFYRRFSIFKLINLPNWMFYSSVKVSIENSTLVKGRLNERINNHYPYNKKTIVPKSPKGANNID